MVIGLVLVILGLIMIAIFPNSIYIPAREVDATKYSEGENITVYGVITDITYIKIFNVTQVILDGKLKVYVNGELKGWDVGDEVYLEIQKTASLEIGENQLAFWTANPENIHSVSETKNYFYLAAISGVVVSIIGLLLKR